VLRFGGRKKRWNKAGTEGREAVERKAEEKKESREEEWTSGESLSSRAPDLD